MQAQVLVHPKEEERSPENSPVYFLAEDPDSLHADRSPYMFEPADNHLALQQSTAVISASNEDFVIKQHTYQMCPQCPSFSIPIPVPKERNHHIFIPVLSYLKVY